MQKRKNRAWVASPGPLHMEPFSSCFSPKMTAALSLLPPHCCLGTITAVCFPLEYLGGFPVQETSVWGILAWGTHRMGHFEISVLLLWALHGAAGHGPWCCSPVEQCSQLLGEDEEGVDGREGVPAPRCQSPHQSLSPCRNPVCVCWGNGATSQ